MCYIIITGGSTLWFTLSLVADMLVVTAIMTPRWLVGPTAYIAAYNTPQHMKSLLLNIENSDHRQQMQRKLQQIQQQQQSHDQQHVINRQVRGRRESDHYDDEMDDVYEVDDDYIEATNAPITTTTRTLLSLPDYRRYPSVGIHSRCKAMQGGDGGFHCGRFDLDGFATDAHIYPDAWKATMFFISLGCVLLSTSVLGTLLSCCRQALCGKSLHNVIACWQVAAGKHYYQCNTLCGDNILSKIIRSLQIKV